MKLPLLAALSILGMAPVLAQAPKPDFSLKGAANAAATQKSTSFGGSVTITTDADWRKQWNEAKGAVPRFAEATSITRGRKIWVLVFFSNARTDLGGQVNVECDLRFIRPDGTTAHEQKNLACFRGRIEGAPGNLRLATQQIEFVGDAKDPAGTWRVEVKLRDTNAECTGDQLIVDQPLRVIHARPCVGDGSFLRLFIGTAQGQ